MSESTFPFAAPDQAQPAVEDAESAGRGRVVALGALAAVALGAGAFLFLGGGGAEEEDDVALPARRAPGAAAAAPAAKPPVVTLPAVSTVVLGRNPFKALYVEPEAAPAEAAPLAAPAANVLPPLQVTVAGGGAQAGPSGAHPAAPAKPVLHKLVLTRVYGTGKDRTAVFSIDGKQQIAKVGATFGPSAELLLLSLQQGPADSQWTAVLQVGDGDPFDVVTGDPAYVP